MVIGLLAIVVVPVLAGVVAMNVSGAGDRQRRLGAFLLGVGFLACAAWFVGRVDESLIEGAIAALGAFGCAAAIWSARRRSRGIEPSAATPSRLGCLAGIGAVIVLVLGGVAWLDATFGQDDPIHVRTAAADFQPWPEGVDVVDARTVMGSPSVSIETAPDVERLYVLVVSDGVAAVDTASAVAAHLTELGWSLEATEPNGSSTRWFDYSGGGPVGERAYVGSLTAYLDSGLWVAEDEGAGPQLQDAAGARADSAVVVQVFAAG